MKATYLGAVAVTYLSTDHKGRVASSGVVAIPVARSTRVKNSQANLVEP